MIVGREAELARIEDPATQAVVITGEPGMGKTALLRTAAAEQSRTLWAQGSQSETDLAFAGLHQLVRPLLPQVEALPAPQREALLSAFGLGPAAPPDPMLLGLAALSLLSGAAEHGHLLAAVDDAQWLDQETLRVLGFVSRRLEGEPIRLLLGVRGTQPPTQLDRGAVHLPLAPLSEQAAHQLLDLQPDPPLGRVRLQILRQAEGNPLALIELAKTGPQSDETGLPLTERLRGIFAARLDDLPPATRRLLLLAAAADSADLSAVLTVANGEAADWWPAEQAGLIRVEGNRVVFRHPLVRSAIYQAASFAERSAAHRVLSDALPDDPDRSVWHLAAAAPHPDEAVAALLEKTADRARQRGGFAAAAAALERAAELSPDSGERARRLVLSGLMAKWTGHAGWVEEIARKAFALSEDPEARAEAALQAGWAISTTGDHEGALRWLLPLAEATTGQRGGPALNALGTAATVVYQSGSAEHRRRLREITARVVPQPDETDRMWALAATDPFGDRDQALAHLRATPAHADGRLLILGAIAYVLDEPETVVRLLGELLDRMRRAVTSGGNALVAATLAWAHLETGAWRQAREVLDEASRVALETDLRLVGANTLTLRATLAALQGHPEQARTAAAEVMASIDPRRSLAMAMRVRHAAGLAALAEGDHHAAYEQLSGLFEDDGIPVHYHASWFGVADLATAAVRVGEQAKMRAVLQLGVPYLAGRSSARLTQLLRHAVAQLDPSEERYREALADPEGERWPYERARVRLDYGRWLRRERRVSEARPLLTACAEVFERLGARPWSDRAGNELRAAGVTATATPDALAELTSQQRQIARLAARGLTNREIGERLFLSPRTVGFHLYRIFPKLGVTSRAQLRDIVGAHDEAHPNG